MYVISGCSIGIPLLVQLNIKSDQYLVTFFFQLILNRFQQILNFSIRFLILVLVIIIWKLTVLLLQENKNKDPEKEEQNQNNQAYKMVWPYYDHIKIKMEKLFDI